MIKEYKKKVTVMAVKWTGKNLVEVIDFTGKNDSIKDMHWTEYEELVIDKGLMIFSLEGRLSANIGDYILKGIHGECWVCDNDIFLQTYEEVNN